MNKNERMTFKSKDGLLFSLSLLFLLSFNILPLTFVTASERDWDVGEVYMWEQRKEVFNSKETTDEESVIEEISEYKNIVHSYRIIEIDELSKKLTYETLERVPHGVGWFHNKTESYNTQEIFSLEEATWFGSDGLNTRCLFTLQYKFDEQTSKLIVDHFYMKFPEQSLIEPDWAHINEVLATSFKSSTAMGTYYHSNYNEIEITLGEFLSEIPSYTIMGKNNLEDARDQLTPTKRRWTFEFDLSGYIYRFFLNRTRINSEIQYDFILLDKCIYKFEIGYTEGGVLEYLYSETDYETTFDGYIRRYNRIYETKLSGIEEVETSRGVNNRIALATFIAIPVSISTWKRKKNYQEVV